MEQSIKKIENDMSILNPNLAAENRVLLSGYYSRMSSELEEILAVKPTRWLLMRKEVKTNRDADMMWDGGEMGILEMKLKLRMKKVEKMISALSSYLRNAENQARFTNV